MGGGSDGFGSAKFGSHTPIEIAERALAVVERLSRQTQRCRGSALNLARAHPKHLAAADFIVRAQPHPGGEGRGAPKLGEVGADLSKQGLGNTDPDAGNLRDLRP